MYEVKNTLDGIKGRKSKDSRTFLLQSLNEKGKRNWARKKGHTILLRDPFVLFTKKKKSTS